MPSVREADEVSLRNLKKRFTERRRARVSTGCRYRFRFEIDSTRPPHPVAGLKNSEKTVINCSRNILPPEGKVKDAAFLPVPLTVKIHCRFYLSGTVRVAVITESLLSSPGGG